MKITRKDIEKIFDDNELKCTYWGGDTDYDATNIALDQIFDFIESSHTENMKNIITAIDESYKEMKSLFNYIGCDASDSVEDFIDILSDKLGLPKPHKP